MNAALKAKLEFITSKYDFTTNVKILNTDDFKQLVTSNDYVNTDFNADIGEQNGNRFRGQTGLGEGRSHEVRILEVLVRLNVQIDANAQYTLAYYSLN